MRYYKLKCWVLISLCTLLCWGCSSSLVQIYEGSSLSNDEIAIISCTDYISEIIEIDGKKMTEIKHSFFTGGSKIALLPGTHLLTAVFSTYEERTIEFKVEAGHSYELARWGNDAVLIDMQYKKTWLEYQSKLYEGMNDALLNKQIKSFVAPTPNPNDVIVRSLEHKPDVRLESIDNKKYSSINTGFSLRLPPGQHSFELRVEITRGFFQSDIYSTMTQEISAYLEPGSRYVIYSSVDLEKDTWEPVLVKDISFKYPDIEFANDVKKQNELLIAEERIREILIADMTIDDLLKLFYENGIEGEFSPDESPSPYNARGVFRYMKDVLIMVEYNEEKSLYIPGLEERLLSEIPPQMEIDGLIIEFVIIGNRSRSMYSEQKKVDNDKFKSMENRYALRKYYQEDGYIMEVFYIRDDPFFICGITKSRELFNKIEEIFLSIGK